MSPQLSKQQLEHAIRNLEKRVNAKLLEAASLEQLRAAAPYVIGKWFGFRDEEKQKPLRDALHNYLSAKMNQALVDLEELELNLKACKQMSSGVIVPGMQIVK